MSGSHEKLPKLFWVQLALALFIGVMFLTADTGSKHADAGETAAKVEKAAANLAPVGKVATASSDTGAAGAGRSGEEVYNGVCATCHNSGIANAPKLDDKAAWESRIANGLDGLIETAAKGKGAMPPNGGDPKITPAELKDVIIYMTKEAGLTL